MGSYAQALQHKQAISDEEFQGKVQELANNRLSLQQKLPTLMDDKGQPTPQYQEAMNALQQNTHDLRELYHPDKNPGAIAKFGHVLTDALKITNPQQRATEQAAKQATATAGDLHTAQAIAAAAPLSPVQQAQQKAQAASAAQLASVQGAMKNFKAMNPNATPEQEQEHLSSLMQGISGAKPVAENFKPQALTLSDGTTISAQYDTKSGHYQYLNGQPIPDDLLHGAVLPKKELPPRAVWAKDAHGKMYSVNLDKNTNQEIPGSRNYNAVPPASLSGRVTTGFYHYVDPLTGEVHQIAETRSSAPISSGAGSSPPTPPAAPPQGAAPQAPSAPPKGSTETMVVPKPKGLVEAGNLPIWNRPTVQNADGSHSSEYSTSFADDTGHEILVPTIVDGKFLTPDGKKPPEGSPEEKEMFKRAWDHYKQTGQNLGKFDNADDADAYSQVLHNRGQKPSVDAVKKEAKTRAPGASTSIKNNSAEVKKPNRGPGYAVMSKSKDNVIGHKGTKDEIDTKAAYEGAIDRTSRMEQNLASALKGDQQAMLSLVANHIGMTLGAQKGARINQAVWNEAVASVPWVDKIQAKFGPDGYLSGVTLAPEQMRQMVNLAHENVKILKEHLDRSANERNSSQPNADATLPDNAKKQLMAGHVTTFGNGQQWTLEDGQPKQVK